MDQNKPDRTGGREKLWTFDFIVLLFMSFFNMFSMQYNTVSLSPWLDSLGLPSSFTGLLTLCFTLPCIVGCFLWGRLSQKTGRRVLIVGGSLMFGAGALLMPAIAPVIGLMVLMRVVQGVGYSAVNNGMAATQADVITPRRLGEGIGFFGMAQTLTLVIGPGAALFTIEHWGFLPVFITIGVLCAAVLVLGILLKTDLSAAAVRRRDPEEAPAPQQSERGLWAFLEKGSLFPCVMLLMSMAALSATNFYAATYAGSIGVGGASVFFVTYAVAEVIIIALTGKLSDRLPMRALMAPGMVIAALGLFFLSRVGSTAAFILASIPVGVGTGLVVPVAQAAAFRGVAKHRRGMASATYYIAFDGGMCLGSLIWGFTIDAAGFRTTFTCAAVLLIVAAVLCFFLSKRREQARPAA